MFIEELDEGKNPSGGFLIAEPARLVVWVKTQNLENNINKTFNRVKTENAEGTLICRHKEMRIMSLFKYSPVKSSDFLSRHYSRNHELVSI